MKNEEKHDFIKKSYIYARATELKSKIESEKIRDKWVANMLPKIPERLYKYRECNENNFAMLKNKTAWFSSPTTWNDPIDVTAIYDVDKDIKRLQENIDVLVEKTIFSFINKYIESFCDQKKFVTADCVKEVYYAAFGEERTVNVNHIISNLIPIVGEIPARQIAVKTQEAFSLYQQIKEEYLRGLEGLMVVNDIKQELLMYSLSETFDNNHQWAMYADSGKGFCIGYYMRPKNDREFSLFQNLVPIYYGEKEALLITKFLDEALTYMMRPESFGEVFDQEAGKLFVSLYTKTPEWIGEQEWRFGIPKFQADTSVISFDFAESIFLGENIADDWREKLITVAKEQGLNVYQRHLDNTKSKWIYTEVKLL